jgi:hypothetical protein
MVFTNRDILDDPKRPWLDGVFVGNTIQLPDDQTLVLADDGKVAPGEPMQLRPLQPGEEGGQVLSLQDDGRFGLRPRGTAGAWETFERTGNTVTYRANSAIAVLGVA